MKLHATDPQERLPTLEAEVSTAATTISGIAADTERRLAAIDRGRLREDVVRDTERQIRAQADAALGPALEKLATARQEVGNLRPSFAPEAIRARALLDLDPAVASATWQTLERLDAGQLAYVASQTDNLALAAAVEGEVGRRGAGITGELASAIVAASRKVGPPGDAPMRLARLAADVDLAVARATETATGASDPRSRLAAGLRGAA